MRTMENYKQLGISLDLALEAHELLRGAAREEVPGVREDKEHYDFATVTTVTILNERGANLMGKPVGTYITMEAPRLRMECKEIMDDLSEILGKKIKSLFTLDPDDLILTVGLGNWHATPDALGPQVIDALMATRHLFHYAPEVVGEGLRPVAALAPGVLGITGIETAEIIKGAVDRIQPKLIIAVDALAASNVSRISTTIQIANTGISPGSGLGNKRLGINEESMGVPVIAIGVPTVVHASVIINDALAKLHEMWSQNIMTSNYAQKIQPALTQELSQAILQPFAGNLVVTPKEVDELILNVSKTIAGGISQAAHDGINRENYQRYLQ